MSNARLCTYCPNPATTEDDVPPKCLFAKPPPSPSALIKVPSCKPCNNGASKDDEYFMVRLVLNREITHPEALAVRQTAIRALGRLKASGFRAEFLGTVEDEEVLTPAGLYTLRNVVTYKAKTERLSNVLRRVTLGLRYHETKQRWEPGETVLPVVPGAIQVDGTRDKLIKDARQLRRLGNSGATARNVLTYWWAPVAGTDGSAWLLRFYEGLEFMTYISKSQAQVG